MPSLTHRNGRFTLIVGIGIDLCEIQRVRELLTRQPRFIYKILSEREQLEVDLDRLNHSALVRLVAKRFAAKEALVKALGGSAGLAFGDASVLHNSAGKPTFAFSARLQQRLPNGAQTHLSISDERGYAIAMVIIELSEQPTGQPTQ